jgi:hypothetical protein
MSGTPNVLDRLAEAQTYALRAAETSDPHERVGLVEAIYDTLTEPAVDRLAYDWANGAFVRFKEHVAAARWSDATEVARVLIPLLITAATDVKP